LGNGPWKYLAYVWVGGTITRFGKSIVGIQVYTEATNSCFSKTATKSSLNVRQKW